MTAADKGNLCKPGEHLTPWGIVPALKRIAGHDHRADRQRAVEDKWAMGITDPAPLHRGASTANGSGEQT